MIGGHVWGPQQGMLASPSQSYLFYADDDASTDDFVQLFGPLLDDNSSHQCPSFCVPCPDDQPLWWIALRWLKMMLLKLARSYHAAPLFLVIAPLTVGLLVGYSLGRWQSMGYEKPKIYSTILSSRLWLKLRDMVVMTSFKFSAWMQSSRLETTTTNQIIDSQHQELRCQDVNLATSKEEMVRTSLKSDAGTARESGVDVSQVPRHVAVIMDGNRRYGKAKYGDVSKGHWDGSSKLVEFAKWCIAEKISVLTVYAFSTENWNRDPREVASLMAIFSKYCDELRIEALQRNIRIIVLSTDSSRIPAHVKDGLSRMTTETQHCTGLVMNICMSYGSRGEILNAARSLANDAASGVLAPDGIDESEFEKRLLTRHCGDPDVLIRTSGEIRISNYLLWQLAYSEMFFIDKPWPAIDKEDLLHVIQTYAKGRIRRFGK